MSSADFSALAEATVDVMAGESGYEQVAWPDKDKETNSGPGQTIQLRSRQDVDHRKE
jgi:hypothetical protein